MSNVHPAAVSPAISMRESTTHSPQMQLRGTQVIQAQPVSPQEQSVFLAGETQDLYQVQVRPIRQQDHPQTLMPWINDQMQGHRRGARAIRTPPPELRHRTPASLEDDTGTIKSSPRDYSESGGDGGRYFDLPESIWALGIAAAAGHARYEDGTLVHFGATLALLTSLTTFLLQGAVIFLIIHDIDPDATPITVTPTSPWVKENWTVNAMKVLMIFFVTCVMFSEAAQSLEIGQVTLSLPRHAVLTPRWVILIIPAMQYFLVLATLQAGIAVVLSCQAVPDILYNSLSITFISGTDDVLYQVLVKLFDFQTDLSIQLTKGELLAVPNRPGVDSRDMQVAQDATVADRGGVDSDSSEEERERDPTKQVSKLLLVVPFVFSFLVTGHSLAKNRMPTIGLGIHRF